MTRRRIGKDDLLALCVLLGFCLFLFRDIVLFNHFLFGSDFVSGYIGYKDFLFRQFHGHGTVPFWNPFIFSGIPFWAHFESTIFYPLDALFWFMEPEKAYGYTMFVHFCLAGIFMYLLARSFHISSRGSFVAAIIYTCNGFIMPTLHVGQMFRVQSYTWIPLIIYFLNQAFMLRRAIFYVALAGFFWGIQLLAGSAQDAFYTFLAAVLLVACRMFTLPDNGSRLKVMALTGLFFVMGAGVAAVQLVPAFEFIGQSVRSVLDRYDLVSLGSYPPQGIATAVMPHFFGSYVTGDFWVSDVPWSVPDYNLYVGVLPLILLFFIAYGSSENRQVVFFAGALALVAFVLALGFHCPVYKIAYQIPGFNRIRAPAKIMVLWVFALALLGARGMDDLFERKARFLPVRLAVVFYVICALAVMDVLCHMDPSFVWRFFSPFALNQMIPEKTALAVARIGQEFHRFVLLSGAAVVIILLWIRGLFGSKTGVFCLCMLLMADVSFANRGAVPHNDNFYKRLHEIKARFDAHLGRDRDNFRVGCTDLVPNLEMYLGYQTVAGYTPLFTYRYYEYINRYFDGGLPEAWVWFSYEARDASILMDLLNVKYEITYKRDRFHPRKTSLPRALIVPGHKILPKEAVLDYITGPEFDPAQVVVLEQGTDVPAFTASPDQENRPGDEARILSYRPDEIVLFTKTSGPAYLLLSEMFYPGWKATVDGHPRSILRGNYLFRVVQIPAGPHVVRFVFDPLSIRLGLAVTALSLFVILCLVIYGAGREVASVRRRT